MGLSAIFPGASSDLAHFSPGPSLLGGLVLGGCSVAYLVFTGQVLGLSGKIRGMVMESFNSNIPFVSGLAAGGVLVRLLAPSLLQALPGVTEPGIAPRMVVGGIAVGLGTAMANGCTSGHGLTGLSRFSQRSLSAVISFMSSAMVTGTLLSASKTFPKPPDGVAVADFALGEVRQAWGVLGGVLAATVGLYLLARARILPVSVALPLSKFLSLTGFGMGLCLSGMAMPAKLAGFLDLRAWDPSLLFVLGGAHLLKTPLMQLWVRLDADTDARPRPVFMTEFACRGADTTTIDFSLIAGSAIFGVGWAMTGLCPGPAIICLVAPQDLLGAEMGSALLFNASFIAGGCLHKCLLKEALLYSSSSKTK